MQIIEQSEQYDVIIVGSGAGGGMSTKILSEAGLKVAVVEAGPYFDPKDPVTQTQWKWPWESPRRGAGTRRVFGGYDMAYGGWEIEGEPYNHIDGTQFSWFRSRMLGGEPIIGEGFHFDLAHEISKSRTEMDWEKTGLLATKMSNLIMIKSINSLEFLVPKKA